MKSHVTIFYYLTVNATSSFPRSKVVLGLGLALLMVLCQFSAWAEPSFIARFEHEGPDHREVMVRCPSKAGNLYRLDASSDMVGWTSISSPLMSNGSELAFHVMTLPPPGVPSSPPPVVDTTPLEARFFSFTLFDNGKSLFQWMEPATQTAPATRCQVLLNLDLKHLNVDGTVAEFPSLFDFRKNNLSPRLHYDFFNLFLRWQPAFETATVANLPQIGQGTYAHFIAAMDEMIAAAKEQIRSNHAPTILLDPIPASTSEARKFYRVTMITDDADGDGLSTEFELQNNLNPFVVDTDDDGFDDAFEISAGSDGGDPTKDPFNQGLPPDPHPDDDDDKDGLSNAQEIAMGTSKTLADSDGDHVWDLYDYYPNEKLLTFENPGPTRYIQFNLGQGHVIDANNRGEVLYQREMPGQDEGTTETKQFKVSLKDVSHPQLLPKTGGDGDIEYYAYEFINDKGDLGGYGSKDVPGSNPKKTDPRAFLRTVSGNVTWQGELDRREPLHGVGTNQCSGDEYNYDYGVLSAGPFGLDNSGELYGLETRQSYSGTADEVGSVNSFSIKSGFKNLNNGDKFAVINRIEFPGEEGDFDAVEGAVNKFTPEGRAVYSLYKDKWQVTTTPYIPCEENWVHVHVGRKDSSFKNQGYFYHESPNGPDDGGMPDGSKIQEVPEENDPHNTLMFAINDMVKETAESINRGFPQGPIAGGSYDYQATFWTYAEGAWKRGTLKKRTGASGPANQEVAGEIKYIEDNGRFWVAPSVGAEPQLFQDGQLKDLQTILTENDCPPPAGPEIKKITSKGLIVYEDDGDMIVLLPVAFEIKRGGIGDNQTIDPATPTWRSQDGGIRDVVGIWDVDPSKTRWGDLKGDWMQARVKIGGNFSDDLPAGFVTWSIDDHPPPAPNTLETQRLSWSRSPTIKTVQATVNGRIFAVHVDIPDFENRGHKEWIASMFVEAPYTAANGIALAVKYSKSETAWCETYSGKSSLKNALRHSSWIAHCASASLIGPVMALELGKAHEYDNYSSGNNWGYESTMDLHNNLIGSICIHSTGFFLPTPDTAAIHNDLIAKLGAGVLWIWDSPFVEHSGFKATMKSDDSAIYP